MRIWVFARRAWAREADAFADELRSEGHSVARANARWYDGEVYADAERIYHDGGNQALVEVHEAQGIECLYVDYAADKAEEAAEDRPAYRVEYAPPWYSIYDRENNKVGKATRDKAKAEARLAALLEGGE